MDLPGKRGKILYTVLAVWTLAALAANFHIAVLKRPHYLALGQKLSGHSGEYYLPRGRIFAGDGTLLAWSERYFDLIWSAAEPCPEKLRIVLHSILKRTPDFSSGNKVICPDIDAEEIAALEPVMRRDRRLTVHSRTERRRTADSRYHELIGQTVFAGGRLTGISGAEKEFDTELAGRPGKYSVMLDRRGRWIDDTWHLLREPAAGKDVTIPSIP